MLLISIGVISSILFLINLIIFLILNFLLLTNLLILFLKDKLFNIVSLISLFSSLFKILRRSSQYSSITLE